MRELITLSYDVGINTLNLNYPSVILNGQNNFHRTYFHLA